MLKATQLHENLYNIKFTTTDIFSHIKTKIYQYVCCKLFKKRATYLSSSEILYQKGYDVLEKDLQNFNVLKNIKKMKAAISFLTKNSSQSLRDVKEILVQ